MADKIKVSEYLSRPLEEVEFPDGEVWKLRQPIDEDYYARQDAIETYLKRIRRRGEELAEKAERRRQAEEKRIEQQQLLPLWRIEERKRLQEEKVSGWETAERKRLSKRMEGEELEAAVSEAVAKRLQEETDKAVTKRATDAGEAAARELIDDEGDEKRLPIEYTDRYLHASTLALFIEPTQTPEAILAKLPPDLMHFLLARIEETLRGDAAKKRLRADGR